MISVCKCKTTGFQTQSWWFRSVHVKRHTFDKDLGLDFGQIWLFTVKCLVFDQFLSGTVKWLVNPDNLTSFSHKCLVFDQFLSGDRAIVDTNTSENQQLTETGQILQFLKLSSLWSHFTFPDWNWSKTRHFTVNSQIWPKSRPIFLSNVTIYCRFTFSDWNWSNCQLWVWNQPFYILKLKLSRFTNHFTVPDWN